MKSFISALFIFISISLHAQGSYKVVFEGPEHAAITEMKTLDEGGFVVSKSNFYPSNITTCDVYTFNNDDPDDTLHWNLNLDRQDTSLYVAQINRIDEGYILVGAGDHYIQTDTVLIISRFNWMMHLDSDKNVVWEKFYLLPDEVSEASVIRYLNLLKLKTGNYLVAETVENETNNSIVNMLLFEIDFEGNIVKSRLFEKQFGGYVMSLTYNHDSTSVLLHVGWWLLYDCSGGIGALILNTETYDTEGYTCYGIGGNDFNIPYDAMIHPNGDLIVAGTYTKVVNRDLQHYLGIKKFDTDFQIEKEIFLTNPDTMIYAAWSNCLDINAEGDICVVGSFDNALGFFTDYYDLVYIAKLDPNLNLLSERYIGRDAEYTVFCMTATSDGGIAVGGYQYDYLVNHDQEGDPFIIKTDAGLWLDVPQLKEENVHRALVYPNPGNNELNIRTTVTDAVFRLYNLNGTLLIEQPVNQLITSLITSSLPQGAYMWTLLKQGQIIDKGKWIK